MDTFRLKRRYSSVPQAAPPETRCNLPFHFPLGWSQDPASSTVLTVTSRLNLAIPYGTVQSSSSTLSWAQQCTSRLLVVCRSCQVAPSGCENFARRVRSLGRYSTHTHFHPRSCTYGSVARNMLGHDLWNLQSTLVFTSLFGSVLGFFCLVTMMLLIPNRPRGRCFSVS